MSGPYPEGIREIFKGNLAAYEKLEDKIISQIPWVFFLPEWQFIDLIKFINQERVFH